MRKQDKARVDRLRRAMPECNKLSDNAVLFVIQAMKVRKNELDKWISRLI